MDIGCEEKLSWPKVNKNYLQHENIDYVVQINEKLLDKYLKNKSIKKIIFVKNRLINILVNE